MPDITVTRGAVQAHLDWLEESVEDAAVADMLDRVADSWESGEFGWIRGALHMLLKGQDSYCAIGGLERTVTGPVQVNIWGVNPIINKPAKALVEAAEQQPCCGEMASLVRAHQTVVAHINDRHIKSTVDAIDWFRRAAKEVRNRMPAS
jgi:hypothetical protein